MDNNAITQRYIQGFKRKQEKNKKKTEIILFIIIILTSLLTFVLIDYIYPIPVDRIAFRINYFLLILGIIWQLLTWSYKNGFFTLLAVVPPNRRKPLFGKNLRHIKEHHPKDLLPFIHPILLEHIIIWIAVIPAAILTSAFIPGSIRKWKRHLLEYAGISLSLGALIYLIFIYISLRLNLTLLTINIVKSVLIGLAIPGFAVLFYVVGSIVSPTRGTPEKTTIGALVVFTLCIISALAIHIPLIERILFEIIFKVASGFWIILVVARKRIT